MQTWPFRLTKLINWRSAWMGLMRAAKKNHRFVTAGILFEWTARRSDFNMCTVYICASVLWDLLKICRKKHAQKSNTADFPIHPSNTTNQDLQCKSSNFVEKVCLCCGKLGYLISSEVHNRLNNPIIIEKRMYFMHTKARIVEAFWTWMSHHTALSNWLISHRWSLDGNNFLINRLKLCGDVVLTSFYVQNYNIKTRTFQSDSCY